MAGLVLLKNHYALNVVVDVAAICKPLIEALGINTFCYMKYFNNNTFYTLTNNKIFLQYRFKQNHRFNPLVPTNILKEKFMYIPNVNDPLSKVISNSCREINESHPIYLIERYEGYFELYRFSGKENNQDIINICLNNMEILERFKFYFKEKAKKIIKKFNTNRICVPDDMQPCFKGLDRKTDKDILDENKYIKQMSIKRYILNGKYEGIALPKQEADTLKYLANGNSIRACK